MYDLIFIRLKATIMRGIYEDGMAVNFYGLNYWDIGNQHFCEFIKSKKDVNQLHFAVILLINVLSDKLKCEFHLHK